MAKHNLVVAVEGKMWKRLLGLVLVTSLAACGGGGGDSTTDSSTSEGSQPSRSVQASESSLDLAGVKDSLASAGIECEGPKPYEGQDLKESLGVQPVNQITCAMEGAALTGFELNSPAEAESMLSKIVDWACGAGAMEVNYLAAGTWVVNADTDGPESQLEALKRVGEVLGIEPRVVTCG